MLIDPYLIHGHTCTKHIYCYIYHTCLLNFSQFFIVNYKNFCIHFTRTYNVACTKKYGQLLTVLYKYKKYVSSCQVDTNFFLIVMFVKVMCL